MILIPILSFFIIDIFLGLGFFGFSISGMDQSEIQNFTKWRFIGLMAVIVLTNGLLTYMVSKTIVKPVDKLIKAAEEIRGGNLDHPVEKISSDELGRLSETFELMRVQLKESNELQKQYEANRKELIASISHDLKTPMTSIQGYIKGLLDGVANTPEKTARYLETIDRKANDLDGLIDELFLFSKLDMEREPFHFETIDLSAYFSAYIEELAFSLEDVSVLFNADASQSFEVVADREKLKRAVDNIIQNALKYMNKTDPEIIVHLQEFPENVEVMIQDNGNGIQAEAVPHIFNSFYRTDASRNSNTGGSGLGLAIVKRIIEGHGGKIWAESQVDVGTAIYFTLKKP